MHIHSVPTETEELIIEFSDRDNSRMNNGEHGKISMEQDNFHGNVYVSSVRGKGHTYYNA